MRYLLDTNHWSFIQEMHPIVISHLHALPDAATLYRSVVSQAELLAGIGLINSKKRRQELTALYDQAIEFTTDVLPITSGVGEQFARVYVNLRRKGRPIDTNDMWIAATAFANDLIVVTSDEHFQFVDGLTVEDWTRPDRKNDENSS